MLTKREQSFKKVIGQEIAGTVLGTTLDWIRENMNPDEVYGQNRINEFVANTATVEEVFREKELQAWAAEKGYVKPDSYKLITAMIDARRAISAGATDQAEKILSDAISLNGGISDLQVILIRGTEAGDTVLIAEKG